MTASRRQAENASPATILATALITFVVVILLGVVWLFQVGAIA